MTPLRQHLIDCMQVRHFSDNTQTCYIGWVRELAKYYHRSPDELQDEELKAFLWYLSLERHLSTSSCAQAFHALNFFYREVLGRTFEQRLLPPMKRAQKIPELLNPLEVQQILAACRKLKYRTMLTLCYGCGLRVSEVAALAVRDIDGQLKTLHIHQAKGAKDRRIPLSPTLLNALRHYWCEYHPRTHLFYKQDVKDEALSIKSVQRVYKKAKSDAGIDKSGGIHALRHAFATHQLMAGMPLTQLQHILGHKNIKTTLRYTHWLPGTQGQDEAFDLIAKLEVKS
jgi:integrase/recombinase XerD